MTYVCFTAKHHDGFCLWDTAYTDYSVTHYTGRDLVRELADGCAKTGMKLALYYSLPDWHCPVSVNDGRHHRLPGPNPGDTPDEKRYKEYLKAQIGELLTNYGKIDALFWDIPPDDPAETDESVNEYVRSLQPGILINDRGYSKGDYSTPERTVPSEPFAGLTEACQSVGVQAWGYRADEDYYSHRFLMESVDRIMTKGGNYLLNAGPMPDGSFPAEAEESVRAVGNWYKKVRESYTDAEFVYHKDIPYGMTRKENCLYVHLPAVPQSSSVRMRPLTVKPVRASVLNTGEDVRASVEYLPTFFGGNAAVQPEFLRISGIPVNRLTDEVIVLRLEFAPSDMDEVLRELSEK
jgi:alpha-L-fucosidase